MNENTKALLLGYQKELESLNISPECQDDYLGMPGLQGLSDMTDAMKHASWLISNFISRDVDGRELHLGLGFIQGILWVTKLRGLMSIEKENQDCIWEAS